MAMCKHASQCPALPCPAGHLEIYHKWPVSLPSLLVEIWKLVQPRADDDHTVCVGIIIGVRVVKHKARRDLHQKLTCGRGGGCPLMCILQTVCKMCSHILCAQAFYCVVEVNKILPALALGWVAACIADTHGYMKHHLTHGQATILA